MFIRDFVGIWCDRPQGGRTVKELAFLVVELDRNKRSIFIIEYYHVGWIVFSHRVVEVSGFNGNVVNCDQGDHKAADFILKAL